jgi:K+-sensing histidine kinase KdpD
LGLSIRNGIIKSLGGNIVCHSSAGGGAEFVVRIPFESPPEDTAGDATRKRDFGTLIEATQR